MVLLARKLVVGLLLVALAAIAASPVMAQLNNGFRLPIEFTQGFSGSREEGEVRPYIASAAVIPGYSFGRVRIAGRLSVDYENPGWKTRIGARIETRVVSVIRDDIGLLVGADVSTAWCRRARLAVGTTFDIDGLLRVGAWIGRNEGGDGGWFGIALGGDFTSWFGGVENDIDSALHVDGVDPR